MKIVLATVAGMFVRFVVVTIVEVVSRAAYPEYAQLEAQVAEQADLHRTVPTGPYVLVLCAWILGTVAAAFVATRISRQPQNEAVWMGVFGIIAVIMDTYYYHHPIWLPVIGVIVTIFAAVLGARLGMGGSVGGSVGESVDESATGIVDEK